LFGLVQARNQMVVFGKPLFPKLVYVRNTTTVGRASRYTLGHTVVANTAIAAIAINFEASAIPLDCAYWTSGLAPLAFNALTRNGV
jgi:hypothetical protein